MIKHKSHLHWSWILMVIFFGLAFFNSYFGLAALFCMAMPIFFSSTGHGKVNCSHYCPRGSFLGRFMPKFTFDRAMPEFMRSKPFKNGFFILMMAVMAFSIISSKGDPSKIGFAVFKMVMITTVIGVILGTLFKPRSWCQICPMGHASGEIHLLREKIKKDKS